MQLETWSADFSLPSTQDTIDTRLCQFNTCIQHLINTLRGTKLSENVSYLMLTCQIHLSSLRNTISKMKVQQACAPSWDRAESCS